MAYPSVTYTFSNDSTADASEVNSNFTDIINGFSDGTKNLNMNAATFAGAVTCNANVTIGNATTDDLTVTSRLASDLIPKTTNAYDLGSSSLYFAEGYITSLYSTSATFAGAVTCNANVTIGNATTDDLTVTSRLASDLIPKTDSTYDLGSTALRYATAWIDSITGTTANFDDFFASLGAVGSPSYSFAGDTDTGMYSSGANTINFATGGATAMTIDSSGLATLSNGINLGDTSLSTYIENTSWTPDITAVGGNITSSVAEVEGGSSGVYVKIGKLVHCSFNIESVIDISGSGACTINFSAPFAMYGGYREIVGQIMDVSNIIDKTQPYGVADTTSSSGAGMLIYFTSTGAITNWARLSVAFTYMAST